MARRTTKKGSRKKEVSTSQGFSVDRGSGLIDKLQDDLQNNQSFLNLVLGALIVIVLGVILFNYFNKPEGDLGPTQTSEEDQSDDVAKEDLPGNYTVKEGDTLFSIAQHYYDNGYKYPELVKANELENEDQISAGQVIKIPKLDDITAASPSPKASETASPAPSTSTAPSPSSQGQIGTSVGEKGAMIQNPWGTPISSDSYTVQAGDWLSIIAGRAYGDIMQYQKIAQANNIQNPNLIEIGQTLKLPR